MPATPSLEAYLAEYESLRNEIFARLESQRQSFSYLATLFAAGIGLAGVKSLAVPVTLLALFLPLPAAALGFIFFDNELVIFRNGAYIERHLRPAVARIAGDRQILGIEEKGFGCLGGATRVIHRLISWGRWLLFLIPTAVPVVWAAFRWGEWRRQSGLPLGPFAGLFAVDVALALLLLAAVVAAYREQEAWRRGFR